MRSIRRSAVVKAPTAGTFQDGVIQLITFNPGGEKRVADAAKNVQIAGSLHEHQIAIVRGEHSPGVACRRRNYGQAEFAHGWRFSRTALRREVISTGAVVPALATAAANGGVE